MTPILTSTSILTLLLAVGLFFFIKASVKDRTESLELSVTESEMELLPKLEQYFRDRAYRIASVDAQTSIVTFEGLVAPSKFLAVFLTLLAAGGIACLALVLAIIWPQIGFLFLVLLTIAPLAGWFYWQRSERNEQVLLKLEPQTPTMTRIELTGHRDELANFRSELKLFVREGIE
jgi:Flp pilus assembly protein TadB